jgi:hypothetical protein
LRKTTTASLAVAVLQHVAGNDVDPLQLSPR